MLGAMSSRPRRTDRDRPRSRRTARTVLATLVAALTASAALTGCGSSGGSAAAGTAATAKGTTPNATAGRSASGAPKPSPPAKPSSPSGWVPTNTALADVCRSKLPDQARDTLTLIAKGGPYPYRSDGIVFENRESRLPRQSTGYYHEYTVVTPGSDDRGTRRVVTGSAGEQYWTGDHYASFQEIDSRC
ncbi:hypothetical protein GCM10010441_16600 [Kitasatospora paracochleata]